MRQSKMLIIAGVILLLLVAIIGSTVIYVSGELAPDGWPVFRCKVNLRSISIRTHREFAHNFSVVEEKTQFKDKLDLVEDN
jgi:hypothetical protein